MFAEQHFNPLNNIYIPITESIANTYLNIYSCSSININGKEYWLNHHCDNSNDELKKYCSVSKLPINGKITITTPDTENTYKIEVFDFNIDYFKKNPTKIIINGLIYIHGYETIFSGKFQLNNPSCIIRGYSIYQNDIYADYNSRIFIRFINSHNNIITSSEIVCSNYILNNNCK